jgi:hypothetical protein
LGGEFSVVGVGLRRILNLWTRGLKFNVPSVFLVNIIRGVTRELRHMTYQPRSGKDHKVPV